MRFGPVPIKEALGKVLGHNIARLDGGRAFKKGKLITIEDINDLSEIGRTVVYVAELEPDDIDENTAAKLVGEAVTGPGLSSTPPTVGRVNLQAISPGVLRVDTGKLVRINQFEEIAISTLHANSTLQLKQNAAKIKIIPFAVSKSVVAAIEEIVSQTGPLIHIDELVPRSVSLILSGPAPTESKLLRRFEGPIRARIEALGSTISSVEFAAIEDDVNETALVEALRRQINTGSDLILLAGETAIMHHQDIAPRAVEKSGGEVVSLGAPVDPGNLLMIAYIDGIPVVGAPSCARSRKANVIDLILPRLIAGEYLSRAEIASLGHGGLLEIN
jgi:hypothetical protein